MIHNSGVVDNQVDAGDSPQVFIVELLNLAGRSQVTLNSEIRNSFITYCVEFNSSFSGRSSDARQCFQGKVTLLRVSCDTDDLGIMTGSIESLQGV